MRLIRARRIDPDKLTRMAVFINAVQIACALGILLYVIFSDSLRLPAHAGEALVAIAAAVVIWGAVVDIRDAIITRRVDEQRRMLKEAYGQLEDLNQTLRRQRHDFKNHLQVVYSLTEMGAHDDVKDYVQRIYEDVRSVGSLLRTSVPAVNALLAAKAADAQERGVEFALELSSAWEDMPVLGWELCRILGWELCRILGNLIDNAMDALGDTKGARICVTIGENIPDFTLGVENNGPEIPAKLREDIFQPGFSTKGAGRGSGLAIVRELVKKYGGELHLESTADCTRFSLNFPRQQRQEED